ncbi:MAG: hypothetical protein AAFX87_09280 [Bacteroidota bacterium]
MMNKSGTTIWFSQNRSQHYQIPDDHALESGSEIIESIAGNEKRVDTERISQFKVTSEEAQSHLEQALEESMQKTKRHFRNLVGFLGDEDDDSKAHILKQSKAIQAMVESFMEVVPLDDDRLVHEPEKEAQEQIDISGRIKEYLNSNDGKTTLNGISEKLRKLAEKLEQPQNLGKSIEDIIKSLGQDLFDELDTEKAKKEQEERIQASVKQSISDSLDLGGFKVFSGLDHDDDNK